MEVTLSSTFDPDQWGDLMVHVPSAIRYWAECFNDKGDALYVKEVVDDWVTPIVYDREFTVNAQDLWRAASLVAHPSFKVNSTIRGTVVGLLVGPDADWDDETVDVLVQAHAFGELVYG